MSIPDFAAAQNDGGDNCKTGTHAKMLLNCNHHHSTSQPTINFSQANALLCNAQQRQRSMTLTECQTSLISTASRDDESASDDN